MGLLHDFLFPKRLDFLEMLTDQAHATLKGVKALRTFLKEPTATNAGRVKELEHEADNLRAGIIHELNRAFVTPIDREDIFALSRSIDDIVDYCERTVEEMRIYRVPPTSQMVKIVNILAAGTEQLVLAVSSIEKNPRKALEYVMAGKKAENHIEHLYLEALADLFEHEDTRYILKMRELYRHLSNSGDRCDEAVNVVSDVVMKIC